MHNALRVVGDGVVIRLRVVPGADRTALCGYDNWRESLKFKTKEPAQGGAANRSIEDFFSSIFGNAVLLSGAKSRQKELLIRGATLGEVQKVLKTAEKNCIKQKNK